jgi:NAD+ synthase (glutamine-hydrolysing)
MIRISLAQQDFLVGDVDGNLDTALRCIEQARRQQADLLVFPELALTGYPPEDLLLRPGFLRRVDEALQQLIAATRGIEVLVGHPWLEQGARFNALSWISEGKSVGRYYKHRLPNYAVFDERRYFTPGSQPLVRKIKGCPIGVLVCEDAWSAGPATRAVEAGAQLLVIPNASPYRDDKLEARLGMLSERNRETGLPLVYCNMVGGQDELVFDGRSLLMDRSGELSGIGPHCREAHLVADFEPADGRLQANQWPEESLDKNAEIYRVLVRGTADYASKNGFSDVVLGLSGGVDSALTLAVCVDALGSDRVHALMMPSRYTSELSLELARLQAEKMGVDYRVIPIESPLDAMVGTLAASTGEPPTGVAHENLQARIRGMLVMTLSNQHGWLPMATSNKSELAVGYSTLYGDMCGGFSPLKDCLKTRVYELARYRNREDEVIPQAVIDRAPSAELRPDQTDQDSLPAYDVLDEILRLFVDTDHSIQDIVARGFDEPIVRKVAGMVLRNEYKRRQGAPGVRVTSRGFGRDRRYPITSGWREHARED